METGIKNLRSADVRQFPWLEAMVAALDDRLRVRHGVIEYTNSPECLFRIQLAASNDDYVLSDGTCIRAGDRVVNLHVWNEQFPYFTGKGPTLPGGAASIRRLRFRCGNWQAFSTRGPISTTSARFAPT